MTTADLAIHIEGCLGLTATVAQDSVKLLFRVCETALAHSGTGESVGIGFGRLHAVPGRHNEAGTWRPAFGPSRTFLQYLDRLQARACSGQNLGIPFPRMHRKDLVALLVGRGIRRAMADRIVKATITFWFDRLITGCTVAIPGGLARVGWKRTVRVRRQAGGALRRGRALVRAQLPRYRRRPRSWLGIAFRSAVLFRSSGLGRVEIVRVRPDRSHIRSWVPGAPPPAIQEISHQQRSDRPPVRAGFLGYGDEEHARRRSAWLTRMSKQQNR